MSVEQEIAKLERQWAVTMVKGDTARCAPFLAERYTFVTVRERTGLDIQGRTAWLTALDSQPDGDVVINDVAVSVHGSIAIATVLATGTAMTAGVEQATELFYTDVWFHDVDRWLVVERYESRPRA